MVDAGYNLRVELFAKKSQKYHDRNLDIASKNENPRKRPENKVMNCKHD